MSNHIRALDRDALRWQADALLNGYGVDVMGQVDVDRYAEELALQEVVTLDRARRAVAWAIRRKRYQITRGRVGPRPTEPLVQEAWDLLQCIVMRTYTVERTEGIDSPYAIRLRAAGRQAQERYMFRKSAFIPTCPVCGSLMRPYRRGASKKKHGPAWVCPEAENEVRRDRDGQLYRKANARHDDTRVYSDDELRWTPAAEVQP